MTPEDPRYCNCPPLGCAGDHIISKCRFHIIQTAQAKEAREEIRAAKIETMKECAGLICEGCSTGIIAEQSDRGSWFHKDQWNTQFGCAASEIRNRISELENGE